MPLTQQCPSLGGLIYNGVVVAQMPCQLNAGHEVSTVDAMQCARCSAHRDSHRRPSVDGHPFEPTVVAGTKHRHVIQWVEPATLEELALAPCPECAAGKHGNCDGVTWDVLADQGVECPCYALTPNAHPLARQLAVEEATDDGEVVDATRPVHGAIDGEDEAAREAIGGSIPPGPSALGNIGLGAPSELCGVGGCVYLPGHADTTIPIAGLHSWER